VLALLASAETPAATDGTVIALFPAQNRAGDSSAARALDRALWLELNQWGQMVEPGPTRDVLRRLRVRNGDRAAPALLRRLGQALEANWLVSTALHDADRRLVPRVTVSARVYSSATGELVWAGYHAASGLDRRGLLGRGSVSSLEVLVPLVVRDLLSELPVASLGSAAGGATLATDPGTVAIVPFAGSTSRRATFNAETVTEAVRARLFRNGVRTLSPNRSHEILRRFQGGRFGGVTAETRAALHDAGGADTILTGAVEAYEVGGSEFEPEPRVAIAMRLLDGATGRLLWTDALEREGWDRERLFASGRIHSRGALADRMVKTLTERLEREDVQPTPRPEGQR
jgi:TolB-like protein